MSRGATPRQGRWAEHFDVSSALFDPSPSASGIVATSLQTTDAPSFFTLFFPVVWSSKYTTAAFAALYYSTWLPLHPLRFTYVDLPLSDIASWNAAD